MTAPSEAEENGERREKPWRLLVLEDTDNDGKMDKRTVFADKLILPGVGHFGQASRTLETTGLGASVREAAARGVGGGQQVGGVEAAHAVDSAHELRRLERRGPVSLLRAGEAGEEGSPRRVRLGPQRLSEHLDDDRRR